MGIEPGEFTHMKFRKSEERTFFLCNLKPYSDRQGMRKVFGYYETDQSNGRKGLTAIIVEHRTKRPCTVHIDKMEHTKEGTCGSIT